jgi:probable HAF family extracellular repeat protein
MKLRFFVWSMAVVLVEALVLPIPLTAQGEKTKPRHYKLVELGTFGGPTSYINPVGNGGPSMNRRGMVVGSSMTSIPIPTNQNGFSCPSPPNAVFHAMQWGDDGVTDLGSLGNPSDCSNALGINDDGVVVGVSENGKLDPLTGVLQLRAVRWKDGRIKNLGTFGGNHSLASSINNRGQTVGFALNTVPDNFSLFDVYFGGPSAGTQTRAFLWENGHKRDLKTLGGPDALATFVNDRAQVAGISYTNSTPNSTTGYPTVDPFLWENGRMTDLGTLGGTVGLPTGLNSQGQVIGQSSDAEDPGACAPSVSDLANCFPFLWDGEKLINLYTSSVGGRFVTASAINDAGEVAGAAAFPNHPFDAAIWRSGVVTDLGVLPGDCFSLALVINSKGQVAGGSFPCDFSAEHAFLWENGAMFDLTALISPKSTAQMVEPNALNDRDEIASDGLPAGCSDFSSCSQAYVLIPCASDRSEKMGCEEGVEGTTAIQNNPSPVTPSPTGRMGVGLTPREVAAEIRARFGRNRALGAWSQK